MENVIFINPFEIFANLLFELRLKPPCNLEEEEDELPDPDELSPEEEDIIAAFLNWVNKNKTKNYKYIGILLNTETSNFENELSNFVKKQQHLFRLESGENFLILHDYIESNIKDTTKLFLEKIYHYIEKFKISKVDLPVLVIFPYKGITPKKHKKDSSSLIISLKQNANRWNGEFVDYITLIFRVLFDTIESIEIDEKQPVNKLKKLYNKEINKHFTPAGMKKLLKL